MVTSNYLLQILKLHMILFKLEMIQANNKLFYFYFASSPPTPTPMSSSPASTLSSPTSSKERKEEERIGLSFGVSAWIGFWSSLNSKSGKDNKQNDCQKFHFF
jgi:hypothetical protein